MTDDGRRGLDRLARAWLARLDVELPAARELRRRLHAEPRLSGQEQDTTDLVLTELGVAGTPVAGTGAWVRVGPPGSSIGVRAELDALPVVERTSVGWAASGVAMHACGHDVHLAALVAVLRAAAALPTGLLPQGVVGVFQPREESDASGGLDVVSSGLLADQGVRAMVGAHVHHGVPAGSVSTGAGAINAAYDGFEVTVTGRGGHGAYPESARDPITALARIALGLPGLVRTTVPGMRPAVISVGTLRAGDGAANAIPDTGLLLASLRTYDATDRERLRARVAEFVTATAQAAGCVGTTRVMPGEPVLSNDPVLSRGTDRWLGALGLRAVEPIRTLGSDDFAYYAERVPSLMCFVGVHDEPGLGVPSLHDPEFLPPDRAVGDVARAMIAAWLGAADMLTGEDDHVHLRQ